MAEEKQGKSPGGEPFHIGRSYEEVGPELGCLHEARHARTGQPALVFIPGERVDWRPEGPWQVRLSYQPEPTSVTLEVEQAPESMHVPDMAGILVMTTAAIQRVEDNPRVHDLFASTPRSPSRSWTSRARQLLGSHAGKAAAACAALALLQGSCSHVDSLHAIAQRPSQVEDMQLISAEEPTTGIGQGYPLPSEPFSTQSAGPCHTKRGEVEINGGCWVALEQRPPCLDVQAEYKGKCYLPVAKPQRPPQATQP